MAELDDLTLLQYFEKDLPASKEREVEEALANDPEAREKLRMLETSTEALQSSLGHLKDLKPPPEIVKLVRESAAKQQNVTVFPPQPALKRWAELAATLVIGVGLGSFALNYIETQSPTRIVLESGEPGDQDLVFRGNGQSRDGVLDRRIFGPEVIKVIFDSKNPAGKTLVFEAPEGQEITVQLQKSFEAEDGAVCRNAKASEVVEEKTNTLMIMACKMPDDSWEMAEVYFRSTG